MDERLKFKIEYDHDARNGIEIEKRGRDQFVVKVTKDIDLINDQEAIKTFENKFNYAYQGYEHQSDNPILKSKEIHRQKVELRKLQEALLSGEDRYNFRLFSH
jgi:hypothetical protein